MNPLVSVILAVKNGDRYVRGALESIVKQDYDPKEIIVVDGQSTDSTPEIVRSFPVRCLMQEKSGIADAYNMGLEAANGEFIAFLSHDDLWASNKLSLQLSSMLRNPELQYTITRGKYFLQEGCSVPSKFKAKMLQGDHVIYGVESLIACRSLFDRIGKFNTEFPVGEDMDWFLRAKDLRTPMAIIHEVLLFKRVHDSSACIKEKNINKIFVRILKQSLQRKRNQ